MNMRTLGFWLALALISVGAVARPSPAGKKEIEAIEKLQAEVIVLQRQIRDLQTSVDRSNGQLLALISQMNDTVAILNRTLGTVQQSISDTQAKVTGNFNAINSQFLALETNLRTATEKLAQMSDQIAGLRETFAEWQRQSPTRIDPTDPVQLFSAAYGDYLRGHYELAIAQFQQFIQRFPSLETTDDAQYWIGECYYGQGRYDQAVVEFDRLIGGFPQSNKLAAARLKKALALLELKRDAEAISELRILAKGAAHLPETLAARQRLEQMGVPVEEPQARPRQTRPRRRPRESMMRRENPTYPLTQSLTWRKPYVIQ